jgi:hypothetical protein
MGSWGLALLRVAPEELTSVRDPETTLLKSWQRASNEYDVQVIDPAQLKAVTKGDEVEVVYTEALAISVSAPTGQ